MSNNQSIQQQFEALAADILAKAQERIVVYPAGDGRARVIQDMKKELMALKEAYEVLVPAENSNTFAQAMKLGANS